VSDTERERRKERGKREKGEGKEREGRAESKGEE